MFVFFPPASQVLTLASWGINTLAVFSGGRLDGPDPEDPNNAPLPVVRYFMPAGWAFAIWGPIILGVCHIHAHRRCG